MKLKARSTILSGSTSTVVVAHALLQSLWGHSHWPNFLCQACAQPGLKHSRSMYRKRAVLCPASDLGRAWHAFISATCSSVNVINYQQKVCRYCQSNDGWPGKRLCLVWWRNENAHHWSVSRRISWDKKKEKKDGSVRNVLIFAQIGKVLRDKYRINRNTHQYHAKFVSVLHSWIWLKVDLGSGMRSAHLHLQTV